MVRLQTFFLLWFHLSLSKRLFFLFEFQFNRVFIHLVSDWICILILRRWSIIRFISYLFLPILLHILLPICFPIFLYTLPISKLLRISPSSFILWTKAILNLYQISPIKIINENRISIDPLRSICYWFNATHNFPPLLICKLPIIFYYSCRMMTSDAIDVISLDRQRIRISTGLGITVEPWDDR